VTTEIRPHNYHGVKSKIHKVKVIQSNLPYQDC